MPLIRKHAAAAALLFALAAAFVSPYLLPVDPDSAAFRTAAYPAVLLFCSFMPAGGALRRASRRTLVCGLAMGLLFAAALSLGAELTFYGGLLPGRGSLVRRITVPFMAAPLLGCLFARLMLLRVRSRQSGRASLLPYAAVLFLLWLPVLLAYFPGMLNYDFAGEYAQHTEGVYSSIHPLLHSVLMNGALALGERLMSLSAGLLFLSLVQMVLFALALGRACAFIRRRAGLTPALLATAFFGLHPVFSTLSCSMTKDTLFAAAVLTLSLDVWEMIEGKAPSRWGILRFVLCTVAAALLRTNGFVALALLFPGFIAARRGKRKSAALLCAASLLSTFTVMGGLQLAMHPVSFPSFQFYSLPAQQLVRANAAGTLTAQQQETLRSWYTDEAGLVVHPHLADPAKGYLDRQRLEREGRSFLSLWLEAGKTSALPYAEAFLMLNSGSWYPDDKSHATIYPDVSWNDKGYLQTQELEIEGFSFRCFLPSLRSFMERVCRRNEYQKWPVVSLLFSPALPFWALVFACFVMIARRRGPFIPAALGALGLWAGYLLGPCTLPRYALPLFCLAPALLAGALALPFREN